MYKFGGETDAPMALNIRKCRKNPIIAEIKPRSPKHGDLLRGRDPVEILRAYERAGAVAISYITEPKHFGGDFRVFKEICRETVLPVLRKDFITTKDEIERTAEAEASAVLLIARILGDNLAEFVDYSLQHNLDPLVEVHTREDVEATKKTNTPMIGINNRDIFRLEMDDGDVSLTKKLAKFLPRKFILVSESGISSVRDLGIALKYADAALIGTAFMRAENPEEIVRSFVEARLC